MKGKKRIFIVGHGMMLDQVQLDNPRAQINFYVNEGIMLNDFFIPGILQIQSGNAGFNYFQLTQTTNAGADHIHSINPIPVPEHIIFILAGDNPTLCRRYTSNNGINVWNRVDVPFYSIVGVNNDGGNNRPFSSGSQYIQIAGFDVNLHSGFAELGFADDILIYPTQPISEGPTKENMNNHLRLSQIIDWAMGEYPNEELKFYWLACREMLQ